MSRNKIHLPRIFPKASGLPVKLIITVSAALVIVFFVASYTIKLLRTTGYFNIKEIVSKEANTADLSYLKGKNIFSLDLKKEAGYISAFYPDYSKIKIIKVLPNRIFVDFVKRKPLAYVKLYRYFALDADGVLFYSSGEQPSQELPLIVGLETKIFGPKPGKKYNIKEVVLALDIIKEIRANRALKNIAIRKIDAATPVNATIFIPLPKGQTELLFEKLVEVKIGQGNIKEKIAVLAGIMLQERNNLENIKYIDLRFKEPVIKLNDK
jgi:cell division septal protein FtsQ